MSIHTPPAPLMPARDLQVTFTPTIDGSKGKPQQAMAVLVPAANEELAAYAVAKARKDGSHVIALSLAAVEKQLGPVVSALGVL